MTVDAVLRGNLLLPVRLVNPSDDRTDLLEKEKFISLEGLTLVTEPNTFSIAPFDINFEFLCITSFLDIKAYMPAFFRYRVYIQAGKHETTRFLQNFFCHRKLNLLRSSHFALVLKATLPKHSDPFMAGSAPHLSHLFDTTHFLLYAEKPHSSPKLPYSIYPPLRLFAVPLIDPRRFINLYCSYKPGESEDEDAKIIGYEIEQALAKHNIMGKYAGITRPPRSTIRPEFKYLKNLDEQKNEEQRESEKQKQKLPSEKRSRLDNAIRRGKKKKVKISSDLLEIVVKDEMRYETGDGTEGTEEVMKEMQKGIEIEEVMAGREILDEAGAEKVKKQKLSRTKPLNSTPKKIFTKSPRGSKTAERKRKDEGFEQENKRSLKTALLQSCKTADITRGHENFNSYWNLIYRSCQFVLRKQMETCLIPERILEQVSNMQVAFYEDQAKMVEKIMSEFGDTELERIEEQEDDVCFVKNFL